MVFLGLNLGAKRARNTRGVTRVLGFHWKTGHYTITTIDFHSRGT